MNGFSKIVLLGNLTRDFEKRQAGAFDVATSALAVNEKRGGKESVMFVEIEAWGKTGETLSTYAQKGSPLLVEGRLKSDTWDDKTTGQKRTKFYVVVDNFRFLGSDRQKGEQRGNVRQNSAENVPQQDFDQNSIPF